MNRVVLSGRLTRDPEIRYGAQSGKCNASATLAVQRAGKAAEGEANADFIRIVAFDKRAEFFRDHIKQGVKIIVFGHIMTGSYTNKDGQKVYTTDVCADEVEFCESKKSSDAGHEAGAPVPAAAGDEFMQIPDGVEDAGLPFQ